MPYNWEQNDWPNFSYNLAEVEDVLPKIERLVGKISGIVEGLSSKQESDALVDLLIAEAIETSDIEGESLLRSDVMSSIKNNLGLHEKHVQVADKRAEGVAEMMILARAEFENDLSAAMLFEWHKLLFKDMKPNKLLGQTDLYTGEWRSGSTQMQVVSGRIGNPTIHFEAPPSAQVPTDMERFIKWFNQSRNDLPGAVRASIAHLYFESIHPFEDGNGRIGRAIAEKALSQSFGAPVLMSLSRSINAKKKDYYSALQAAQRGNEITPWINYFTNVIYHAQDASEKEIRFILKKSKFYQQHASQLNTRQNKVIERMFEEGADGFKGGMTAKKYINLTKTSKATATRDLQDLLEKGALLVIGAGRNTHYELSL